MTTSPDATTPRPTALVQAAVEALVAQFFEPLDPAELFTDAWEGASQALTAAGTPAVPAAPAYPDSLSAAIALHQQWFPALEALAESSIGWEALAVAALRELGLRRRDGHTAFSEPTTARFLMPFMTGTLGLDVGLALSPGHPLCIASVVPGGPAQRAGLHRGLELLAINGRSVERWHRMAAFGLLTWEAGVASTLRVRPPGGAPSEVALPPAPAPLLRHDIVGGTLGYLRFDSFPGGEASEALVGQLGAELEDFERRGIVGWVLDLRWNQGGMGATTKAVTSLFVAGGRLWRGQARVELPGPDGTLLPRVRDEEAEGAPLPFQRPLAILIGPGSSSGAELCAGALQALGRATLIGEQTPGWLGSLTRVPLADGWTFSLCGVEALLGPDLWRRNRVGLAPDIPITPTADDEVAGRDPQLDVAIQLLSERAAGSVNS